MPISTHQLPFRLMQVAVFSTLLGRGLLYLFWDGPFRVLLWDESLMSSFVARMGYSWSEWVTSLRVEESIQLATKTTGLLFVCCAIAPFLVRKFEKFAKYSLLLAVTLSFIHVSLSTKAHFYQLGQFIELSLQWMSPILLLWMMQESGNKVDYAFRIVIALTFIGHGMYAVGYYPVPGNFQDMVMSGFGLSRADSILFLRVVGVLDFVAALLLLLPNRKWACWGLYYIVFWGVLTTFARLWSYVDLVSSEGLLLRWLPEHILRWVHFLSPLALWFLWQKKLPLRKP
ncbi:MAG: hypothetical protein AAGJ93_01320 [Bacteroidota bacterium]